MSSLRREVQEIKRQLDADFEEMLHMLQFGLSKAAGLRPIRDKKRVLPKR